MHLAALYIQSPLPRLTIMAFVAVLCCLMYAPPPALAEITPLEPFIEYTEIEVEAEAPPRSSDLLRPNLLRPCLGQAPAANVQENTPPRKKKKKSPDTDQKNMLFLAWLAILCPPHHAVMQNFAPSIVREDIPYLPSWRGFVFFSLPPPSLA